MSPKKKILLLLTIIVTAGIRTYTESKIYPINLSEKIGVFVAIVIQETATIAVFSTKVVPYTAKKLVQVLNTCASNNSLKIYDPCISAMAYLSLSISETNP